MTWEPMTFTMMKLLKLGVDKQPLMCYNKGTKEREVNNMKVWGYNCYGICIKRIEVSKIEEWNATHPLANQKIVDWKE